MDNKRSILHSWSRLNSSLHFTETSRCVKASKESATFTALGKATGSSGKHLPGHMQPGPFSARQAWYPEALGKETHPSCRGPRRACSRCSPAARTGSGCTASGSRWAGARTALWQPPWRSGGRKRNTWAFTPLAISYPPAKTQAVPSCFSFLPCAHVQAQACLEVRRVTLAFRGL